MSDSTATTADTSASSNAFGPTQLKAIQVTAERLNDARSGIETQTGASTHTIDAQAIEAIPGGQNNQLNQVLLQAPDVVQDSFGQIHVRADHNDLQYRLNGIILPEGIIDLSTNSGLLQPGGEISLYGGSHSTYELSAEFGGSVGQYT